MRFQFGLETFNLPNHTQFDSVGASIGSPDFGKVNSSLDPRVMQLRAKLSF